MGFEPTTPTFATEGIATDDPPVYFWPSLSVFTITSVETFH